MGSTLMISNAMADYTIKDGVMVVD
jgi:hypothetical protein